MLFDLEAKGRRTAVKVIYGFLAVLIGGGLVFFGIGGSGTGLLDAGDNSPANSGGSFGKQASAAEKSAAKPGVAPAAAASAWASAAQLRFQAASAGFNTSTGQYTTDGVAQLQLAATDWQNYLAAVKGPPDVGLAKLMAQAYGVGGLIKPEKAVQAWQIVAAAEPSSAAYAQLAVNAYLAGDNRIGDQAAQQALAGLPPAQQLTLKTQFKQAQRQAKEFAKAKLQQAQQSQSSSGALLPGG